MEVLRMEVSPLMTNCYLVWDENSGDGIVIDPGGDGDRINQAIDAKAIHVVAIVDTHGHWDHIGANGAVKEHTGAPLFIHEADAAYLDGNYAAFGRVTEGIEVAEQIARDARPTDNNGTVPPEQQPVIESIVITD